MPPTQTTAPSMCSAKASAAMSGRPVRGTIKRYYSGSALYVTFRRSGIWTLRTRLARRVMDGRRVFAVYSFTLPDFLLRPRTVVAQRVTAACVSCSGVHLLFGSQALIVLIGAANV